MISPEQEQQSILKVVKDVQLNRFWGSVTLDIRDGHVMEVRIAQTIKTEKLALGEQSPCLLNVSGSP